MPESTPPRNRANRLLVVAVLVLLAPLGYSVVAAFFVHDTEAARMFLEKPDPAHTECVRSTTYMRLHHWELLTQIREEVVRYGNRGQTRLNNCQECHTSRQRFCNRCHEAVNLYPECWGCHYYP